MTRAALPLAVTLRRAAALLAILGCALLAPGCAHYHTGSVMHPQVHSIAIARVRNQTDEPRLATQLQDKLRAAFMLDHSLAVVDDPSQADSLLEARVLKYEYVAAGSTSNQATNKSQRAFVTNLYQVIVTVEFTVKLPDRAEPLLSTRGVTGTAEFTDLADLEIARRQAFGVALAEAARRVVSGVTEAW